MRGSSQEKQHQGKGTSLPPSATRGPGTAKGISQVTLGPAERAAEQGSRFEDRGVGRWSPF